MTKEDKFEFGISSKSDLLYQAVEAASNHGKCVETEITEKVTFNRNSK